MPSLFAFLDNPVMMLALGALAVLLFGERLPEVARSIGKGFMELKRGVYDIKNDIEGAINDSSSTTTPEKSPRYDEPEERDEATAPKFEPPTSEPFALSRMKSERNRW